MICRECPAAKRFGEDGVYCLQYGMIIRAGYECEREGWKDYEEREGDGLEREDGMVE